MPTFEQLATLDLDKDGVPFFSGALSLPMGTLDYDKDGVPAFAVVAVAAAPDTVMYAEFSMRLSMAPAMTTAITLAASFTPVLTFQALHVNSGSAHKMEIIF